VLVLVTTMSAGIILPLGGHLAHLPLHVVSGENLVWALLNGRWQGLGSTISLEMSSSRLASLDSSWFPLLRSPFAPSPRGEA
jgi:hypothetical protein